ncbi:hypothetical protein EVAR_35670_1 [Eumeta japonica]|uniref:Uncharacterized protein n=1 Tax=Eumeta variegata TaxID=151549 RepID=A0A4C1VG17_EUMVA|nr:hypothetical protein EVAR_35670_1 [Eumeta japonica]
MERQRIPPETSCGPKGRRIEGGPNFKHRKPTSLHDNVDGCRIFEEVPNAETLSRHESPDCGAKRGLRMCSNSDTTNAT